MIPGDRAVHTPVLLEEVLGWLALEQGFLLVDATLGEGGHAQALLAAFPGLKLYGVEADQAVLVKARARLEPYHQRVKLFHEWYNDFFKDYQQHLEQAPDRIFFDLGISRFHYERSGRGFSFFKDEPLDMRIGQGLKRTAADLINQLPGEKLNTLIASYGEERMSRRISQAIIRARQKCPINRAKALAEIIWRAVPASYRHRSIHPATRTFQALRIAVNQELDRLERGLKDAVRALKRGGRMGVISFHSLEDRIVKRFFVEGNKSCTCPPELPICQCGGQRVLKILTKKPVSPSAAEIRRNPAARSAKLRVVEKLIA